MKYLTITFLLIVICCLFISETNGILGFGKGKKKEDKGKCSLYKGTCGGTLSKGCCKAPFKCGQSTAVCGKGKSCCITETDIQRHKQTSGSWIANRNGK